MVVVGGCGGWLWWVFDMVWVNVFGGCGGCLGSCGECLMGVWVVVVGVLVVAGK